MDTRRGSVLALAFLALALLAAAVPARAAEIPAMSLVAAERVGLETSPELREARSRLAEALYAVDEAGVPGRPQVRIVAGYTYLTPDVTFSPGGAPIAVVEHNNYSVTLGASQPLATFGRLEWGTRAARANAERALAEVRAEEARVVERVRLAWLDSLRADQDVDVAADAVQRSAAHLKDADALMRAGVVARFDVMRSESALSAARQRLLTARGRQRVSAVRLRTLLGLPPDAELAMEALPQPPPPPPLDEALARALQARPDVRALERGVEAALAKARLEASQDNPSLGLVAEYARRNPTGLARDHQWSVGVRLDVPLYDGGLARSRSRQAGERAEQARARLDALRRAVTMEVAAAHADMATAWDRADVARQNLAEAEEALRVAGLRYRGGVATNVEVLDAETARTAARHDVVAAGHEYRAALARWLRATTTEESRP